MAFDGSTNCWWPALPVTVKRKPRLNIAQFGDGYEQRQVDGINTMVSTWDLKFVTKPDVVLVEMDLFLQNRKGAAFPFKDPVTGGVVMVFCDDWSIEWTFRRYPVNGPRISYGTLSATFRRAYGVGLAA
jgi:phage-related protein